MRIFVVDAFTNERFQGNRAGVVLEANALSSKEKQQIASEINAAETAFVVQLERGEFKVDYYTPTTEIDFCGHATVGSFHTLANIGVVPLSENESIRLQAHTRAGVFPVEISFTDEGILVGMTHSQSEIADVGISSLEVAQALNLKETDLSTEFRPLFSKTANWHLIVGVKDRALLDNISYDTEKLSKILLSKKAVTAHVFTPGPPQLFHARNFGPTVGIPEDPGTGSAAAAFGAYLANTDWLADGANVFKIIQGEKLGRTCEIGVNVKLKNGKFSNVTFFGSAVASFELSEYQAKAVASTLRT